MANEIKTPELEAIEKLQSGVNEFKDKLAGKVDVEKFEAVETQLKDLETNLNDFTDKQFSEKIDEVNKAIEKLNDAMEKQTIKAEQSKFDKAIGERLLTKDKVEAFLDNLKNKTAAELQMKAAETFGYDQTFTGYTNYIHAFTGREVDPTLYQAARKTNIMLDYFPIVPISVPRLFFLEKSEVGSAGAGSDPGAADWILAGGAKPQRSFRLTAAEEKAKKIAIFGTIQDELLNDVPSFQNWLRDDFTDEMAEQINYGLLKGDDVTNVEEPEGLTLNAIQYTATTAYTNTISAVNYIDMIFAVAALFADNREVLSMVFVSPDVYYLIHHLKNSDESYKNNNLVYFNNAGQLFIGGIPVVMADKDDVASTHILAVNFDAFKIRSYGNLTIEAGLNGSDFQYDRTSYRAYQRFITYLPTHRRNGVLYDTWANIESAIVAP